MGRPVALVFRGESTEQDDDLAEPLAEFLRKSPLHFKVRIVGPDEDEDLDEDSLEDADLLAMPGGPDLDDASDETKGAKRAIRKFVSDGGRYFGVCLGAYLAGHSPGFGLLPKGADTDSECEQKGAQVTDDEDAIIQVDWTYSHGEKAGQTHKDQWIFFQEGPCIKGFEESDTSFILGRYSKDGRIASTLSKFGDGWVGLIGPHPEADQSWFDDAELEAPQGLRYDIGFDLIESLMSGRAIRREEASNVSHSHKRLGDRVGGAFDKIRDLAR